MRDKILYTLGAIALVIGVPFAFEFGIQGALVGLVLSYVLIGVIMFALFAQSVLRETWIARI